ncbi:MAG TPA: hypothetical protein PKJ33_02525 [Alphaproteobacteria bacterium]|nr:hypothetical protein [Alphaproteobacteria bacterium]
MSRTKKFIVGTMLVTAGLLAGNISAKAQDKKLETKDKTKKEIVKNTEKKFEETGFSIIVQGKDLMFNYDIEKMSQKAKTGANNLNKIVSGLIKDYHIDKESLYNLDDFNQKKLDFMIKSVNEANRFVIDSLVNLPLSDPKYEAVKHYLVAMFIYINQNTSRFFKLPTKIPTEISIDDSVIYRRFANFAMRVAFMRIVVETELEETLKTNNLLIQKTRQK